jgi:hypothetical protein
MNAHEAKDFSCEILIIGSGIAGQAVLSQLDLEKQPIIMIEAGQFHASKFKVKSAKRSLRVATKGDRYFGIGGTSNIWGGNVVPYTNLELSSPLWPIKAAEVQQYLSNALNFLGFGDQSIEILQQWERSFLNCGVNSLSHQFFYRMAENRRKVDNVAQLNSPHFELLDGVFCRKLEETNGAWSAICENTLNETIRIRFKYVVIASGGLESIRLLSRSTLDEKILNKLGLSWSPHLTGIVGFLTTNRRLPFVHETLGQVTRTRYLHLSSVLGTPSSSWKITLLRLRTSLLELPKTRGYAIRILLASLVSKLLGSELFLINADGDQEPGAHTFVQILKNGGLIINHQASPKDHSSIKKMQEMSRTELSKFGNVFMFRTPERYFEGRSHHLGGVRMSQNREQGIVDANLSIHDHQNIFVCSTAVFPTFSSANPTLLLTQLAIRLGQHLRNTNG